MTQFPSNLGGRRGLQFPALLRSQSPNFEVFPAVSSHLCVSSLTEVQFSQLVFVKR